jgi:hypothetical protein
MRLAGALVLSLALSAPASALTLVYEGTFTPEGGVGATGTGSATITFDTDTMSMDIDVTWSGTSGTSTVAHIHCCTTNPGTGNAGVATQTPSFSGFPTGVTGGTYQATFDMSLASSWNAAYITANGGTTTSAFNALISGLNSDRAYFNIHTSTFGGGEIRARLELVPEPGTLALGAFGLLGLAALRRRRRS